MSGEILYGAGTMFYTMNHYDIPSLNQYQSENPDTGDILRFKMISRYCSGNVLDAGCGSGALKQYLDKSKVSGYLGLDTDGRIDIYGSVYHLPFKDEQFDTVVMSEILEHLENAYLALKEVARVAKKNIIISIPNPWCINQLISLILHDHNLSEPNHVNLFGDNEINQISKRCNLSLVQIIRCYIPIPKTRYYLPFRSHFGENNIYICKKQV